MNDPTGMLQHFKYEHLSQGSKPRELAEALFRIAETLVRTLPANSERQAALRHLHDAYAVYIPANESAEQKKFMFELMEPLVDLVSKSAGTREDAGVFGVMIGQCANAAARSKAMGNAPKPESRGGWK